MPKRKRDKSRSKTPEIPWELLLAEGREPTAPVPPKKVQSRSSTGKPDAGDAGRGAVHASASSSAPAASAGTEPPMDAETARRLERDTWRNLVGKLGALKDDLQIQALLKERHPELMHVAEACGAGSKKPSSSGMSAFDKAKEAARESLSLDKAKVSAQEWFARRLRGSNRQGPAERTKLLQELLTTLKAHSTALLSLAGTPEQSRLEQLLAAGPAHEEGPLICTLLAQDLQGSRYENLWISRQAAGLYILGDGHDGSNLPQTDLDGARIHPRVCVVVKAKAGKLMIDGFYHEGEEDFLNPARVPVGPFLTVYYEGMPLKEALGHWKNGPPTQGKGSIASGQAAQAAAMGGGQEPALPPGWEKRESRSKKGVYYYANPSKGLSTMERPTA